MEKTTFFSKPLISLMLILGFFSIHNIHAQDNDNDNVLDNVDLDDDNDGILDIDEFNCSTGFVALGSTFPNDTSNPGSRTGLYPFDGVTIDLTYELLNGANWNNGVGSNSAGGITGDFVNSQPNNTDFPPGDFYPSDAGTIDVALHTFNVQNGPIYNLTFSHGGLDNQDKAQYIARLNGVDVPVTITNGTLANGNSIIDAVNQSVTSSAGGSNAPNNAVNISIAGPIDQLIVLTGKENGNGGNVTTQFFEFSYCTELDTDGDSIPDHLDTDSDDDGCPDAIEGAGSFTASDLTSDDNLANVPADVDTDGVPNVGSQATTVAVIDDSDNSACPPPLIDSDNDGVPDSVDLDNDNDGILDSVECPNLLIQGGFENVLQINGDPLDNGNNFPGNGNSVDISPWVLGAGNDANVVQVDGAGGFNYGNNGPASDAEPITGDGELQRYLDIANGSNDFFQTFTLSQTSTITYRGFMSARNNGGGIGSISILDGVGTGGTVLDTTGDISITDNTNWLFLEGSVTLAAGTYTYLVSMNNDVNFDNASVFNHLDSDNDGTPDYLDTDSDNDGCPDAIEAAGSFEAADLTADDNLANTPAGVDAQGIPTIAGSPQATTAAVTDDTDSSACDVDTDGDGVLDATETANGTDPNDPCDFDEASITETQTGDFLVADCDGDGVTNGDEITDGTDPNDPCDFDAANITLAQTGDFLVADCDGDGVTNGDEITDGTDPISYFITIGNSITITISN